MPDPSPISLNIELGRSSRSALSLGVRLDPDVGRVSVSSYDLEASGGRGVVGSSHSEGDEGGGVAGVEVRGAGEKVS